MAASRRRRSAGVRPEAIGTFLDVAYDLDAEDQAWLTAVLDAAADVWGRGGLAHGLIYDASDVEAFRPLNIQFLGFPDEVVQQFMDGLGLLTPGLVTRTFRSLLVNSLFNVAMPEMGAALATVAAAGCADALAVNGLDPSGLGVTLFLWGPDRVAPTLVERELFLRLSHHLGAAYRCRRRLRESQLGRPKADPTDGAEAILDARRRIVHAVGPAQASSAQSEIRLTAEARDRVRVSGTHAPDPSDVAESLRGWRPLTRARWTLVDSFEQGGARYVVARENQSRLQGLERLTDRERQVVAYLSVGQSTKETAYALGVSDTTVRVLLSRAAKRLGVRSRAALLAHDEVRRLGADKKTPVR